MHDDALIAWLEGGSKVELAADEVAAELHKGFAALFLTAMNPDDDLGPTDEEHQAAVARRVWDVHQSLNIHGEETYSAVWRLMSAPVRAAIKRYVSMAGSTLGGVLLSLTYVASLAGRGMG